ncbi:MAG: DNA damage-inducible protein D [Lachnospiraceae bacterium]|nr:DNA damage-inducible protein D [Lachnospiraceae bacterium]
MEKSKIILTKSQFDDQLHFIADTDIEYWLARDLMILLGYERWENFEKAIGRAMESCETSDIAVTDHFREVTKMVQLGNGAKRYVKDYMLTRYACYLIAQNGDPRKEEIAFAQSYFAVQTRKQELIEERIAYIERAEARGRLRESEKRLSQNIYERGVDDAGFGRIRSKGDQALFGGHSTQDMKSKLGVKANRPLADFLPTLTIAAKNLAVEMTNYNVEEKDLQGETEITVEHVQNNSSVRSMLSERGIKPEELPPSEDIKKRERRVKSQEKKLAQQSGKLPNSISDNQEE